MCPSMHDDPHRSYTSPHLRDVYQNESLTMVNMGNKTTNDGSFFTTTQGDQTTNLLDDCYKMADGLRGIRVRVL